jgi:hypothetical protein
MRKSLSPIGSVSTPEEVINEPSVAGDIRYSSSACFS